MKKIKPTIEDWIDRLDTSETECAASFTEEDTEDESLQEFHRLVEDCNKVFARANAPQPDVNRAWAQFKSRQTVARPVYSKTLLWGGWIGAAACIVCIVLFQLFFAGEQIGQTTPSIMFTAVHESQRVTIADADGAVWELDNEQVGQSLKKQGITVGTNKADYRQVTHVKQQILTVPRGKDCYLVLSDGTEVWMNAESKLFYPSRFTGDERVVRLEGEAYFKVAKNKEHPFVVTTQDFKTRVLGTEFNVKSYANNRQHVTLVSGEIAVRLAQTTEEVKMLPGQDLSLSVDGRMTVQQVDTYHFTQWKEGYFYFDRAPLQEILYELGRWYNVDIEMNGSREALKYHLHYVADKHAPLAEALEKLNALQIIKATYEGNKIVLR